MAFMFENREVYQKAVNSADEMAALSEGSPRGFGFLTDQLNRASRSIATNLAEGSGRCTKPDRRPFFTVGRGSAQECVPLLEVARRRGLVSEDRIRTLRDELETIAKMISGLVRDSKIRRIEWAAETVGLRCGWSSVRGFDSDPVRLARTCPTPLRSRILFAAMASAVRGHRPAEKPDSRAVNSARLFTQLGQGRVSGIRA